jgi:hypothetical protein
VRNPSPADGQDTARADQTSAGQERRHEPATLVRSFIANSRVDRTTGHIWPFLNASALLVRRVWVWVQWFIAPGVTSTA